jgi:tetratricopeptide (TPR) repeat protein
MLNLGNEQVQFESDYARVLQAETYILRHLAQHLHQAGQLTRLYRLLLGNHTWMESKYYRLNGDTPYMRDLDLALSDFSDILPFEQISILVQLHTAQQVVNHRVNIDIKYLHILTWLGREEEAIATAQLIEDPQSRFSSLLGIYRILEQKRQFRPDLLNMLKKAASEVPRVEPLVMVGKDFIILDEIPWLKTLNELTTLLACVGDDQAVTISDEVQAFFAARPNLKFYAMHSSTPFDYSNSSERALALLQAGRFEEVRKIRVPVDVELICKLAVAKFNAGEKWASEILANAEERARKRKNPSQYLNNLLEVALAWHQLNGTLANSLLDEVIDFALNTTDVSVDELRHLGEALEDVGDSRAMAIYRHAIAEIPNRKRTIYDWRTLGTLLVKVGDRRALGIVNRVIQEAQNVDGSAGATGDDAKVWALSDVGMALAGVGDSRARIAFDAAIDIMRTLPSTKRLYSLQHLASDLAQVRDSRAKEIFDELKLADRESQANEQWTRTSELGLDLLIRVKDVSVALEQIQTLRDEKTRSTKLQTLAVTLGKAGDSRASRVFDEAVAVTRSMVPGPERAIALQELGEALAQVADGRSSTVFGEAIEEAHNIHGDMEQLTALRNLAEALARSEDARSREIFDEVIARTNSMKSIPPDFLLELGAALSNSKDNRADSVLQAGMEGVRAIRSHGGDMSWVVGELQRYTHLLIKIGWLDAAKERGLTIGGPGTSGADARSALAAAFARAERFEEAQASLQAMEQWHDSRGMGNSYRLAAIRDVALALVKAGQLDEAKTMADSIDNPYRLFVLSELTSTYILQEDDRAQEMLDEVISLARVAREDDRIHVLRQLSLTLARKNRWSQALAFLGPFPLVEFFQLLGEFSILIERFESGLPKEIFFAATAIAGWVDVNWRKIHEVMDLSHRHN